MPAGCAPAAPQRTKTASEGNADVFCAAHVEGVNKEMWNSLRRPIQFIPSSQVLAAFSAEVPPSHRLLNLAQEAAKAVANNSWMKDWDTELMILCILENLNGPPLKRQTINLVSSSPPLQISDSKTKHPKIKRTTCKKTKDRGGLGRRS